MNIFDVLLPKLSLTIYEPILTYFKNGILNFFNIIKTCKIKKPKKEIIKTTRSNVNI